MCPCARKIRKPLWNVDLTVRVDEDPSYAISEYTRASLLLSQTMYRLYYADKYHYGAYSLSARRDSLTLYYNDKTRLVPWWRFRFFSDLTFAGSKFGYWNYGYYDWFNADAQQGARTKQVKSKDRTYLRQRGSLIVEFNTI